MPKNISKIYRRSALMILTVVISGLLNVCLFALQAKAATPQVTAPKIHFAYNQNGACVEVAVPASAQSFNYPTAPMPECCLAQNRNFNATVNTANNKSTPTFTNLIISPAINSISENNSTYNTSKTTSPPPATLALISTIIRE